MARLQPSSFRLCNSWAIHYFNRADGALPPHPASAPHGQRQRPCRRPHASTTRCCRCAEAHLARSGCACTRSGSRCCCTARGVAGEWGVGGGGGGSRLGGGSRGRARVTAFGREGTTTLTYPGGVSDDAVLDRVRGARHEAVLVVVVVVRRRRGRAHPPTRDESVARGSTRVGPTVSRPAPRSTPHSRVPTTPVAKAIRVHVNGRDHEVDAERIGGKGVDCEHRADDARDVGLAQRTTEAVRVARRVRVLRPAAEAKVIGAAAVRVVICRLNVAVRTGRAFDARSACGASRVWFRGFTCAASLQKRRTAA